MVREGVTEQELGKRGGQVSSASGGGQTQERQKEVYAAGGNAVSHCNDTGGGGGGRQAGTWSQQKTSMMGIHYRKSEKNRKVLGPALWSDTQHQARTSFQDHWVSQRIPSAPLPRLVHSPLCSSHVTTSFSTKGTGFYSAGGKSISAIFSRVCIFRHHEHTRARQPESDVDNTTYLLLDLTFMEHMIRQSYSLTCSKILTAVNVKPTPGICFLFQPRGSFFGEERNVGLQRQ